MTQLKETHEATGANKNGLKQKWKPMKWIETWVMPVGLSGGRPGECQTSERSVSRLCTKWAPEDCDECEPTDWAKSQAKSQEEKSSLQCHLYRFDPFCTVCPAKPWHCTVWPGDCTHVYSILRPRNGACKDCWPVRTVRALDMDAVQWW